MCHLSPIYLLIFFLMRTPPPHSPQTTYSAFYTTTRYHSEDLLYVKVCHDHLYTNFFILVGIFLFVFVVVFFTILYVYRDMQRMTQ